MELFKRGESAVVACWTHGKTRGACSVYLTPGKNKTSVWLMFRARIPGQPFFALRRGPLGWSAFAGSFGALVIYPLGCSVCVGPCGKEAAHGPAPVYA